MPIKSCAIIKENQEGYSDFNIHDTWYQNRKRGISAVVRCYAEEQWIGPCLESILPLFDEIIVTHTPKEGDRTADIVKSFHHPKIKILEYPFRLKLQTTRSLQTKLQRILHQDYPGEPTVHSYSYYTNWGMSKTHFSHVASRWDADMILRPEYATKHFHDLILKKTSVSIRGWNVMTPDFKTISADWPLQGPEARFIKVNPYRFHYGEGDALSYRGPIKLSYPARWRQFPVQQAQCLYNTILHKDIYIRTPIFFHTKLLKDNKGLPEDRYAGSELYGWNLNDFRHKALPINAPVPAYTQKQPTDYLNKQS